MTNKFMPPIDAVDAVTRGEVRYATYGQPGLFVNASFNTKEEEDSPNANYRFTAKMELTYVTIDKLSVEKNIREHAYVDMMNHLYGEIQQELLKLHRDARVFMPPEHPVMTRLNNFIQGLAI